MKLVIKPHRPRQRILVAVVGLVLVAAAVASAFHYGNWRSITRNMGLAHGQRGIMDEYVDLKRENERLSKANGRFERSIEIDKYARQEHQQALSDLQGQIAELKLELAFYRDILSSTEVDTGPLVRGLKLRDFGGQGRYQYRLVLTHVNKDDKVANGWLDVEIRGRDGDTLRRVSLAELAEPDSRDLKFRFKHFRRIEGVFQLPEDFDPDEIRVAVYEDGRKRSSFNKTYNWAKVVN